MKDEEKVNQIFFAQQMIPNRLVASIFVVAAVIAMYPL